MTKRPKFVTAHSAATGSPGSQLDWFDHLDNGTINPRSTW
jgi:hypothetical protein